MVFPQNRRVVTLAQKLSNYGLSPNTITTSQITQIFEQFFKEHETKGEEEKEFFKKLNTEPTSEKYDPYKVLEIENDSSLEKAKEAYRKLAIKYHPKNDNSPEAETKFAEVAKAYETILEEEKSK